MSETVFWFGDDRHSKFYVDPKVKNGECKTIKPADPELLAKNKKLIEAHKFKVSQGQFWQSRKKNAKK